MSAIKKEDILDNPITQDLCVFDSVHDFWKERKKKTKSASSGDDDGDDDVVDESLLAQTQNTLLRTINKKTRANAGDISQLIRNMTNRYVDNFNASKYERSIRDYYETNPLLGHVAEHLTYDDVIDNRNKWTKYLDGASTMISLEPGTKYSSFGAVMGAQKQNIIAEFILRYLFSQTRENVYLTFDASTGVLRNIFRELEQVFNLITPANIADSAPTSFNRLHNGRNVFYFPKGNRIPFHSNYFTQDVAEMEIVNNGFSDKNNYGFDLRISPKTGKPLVFPFSAKQSSGPSVNYLVSLLLNKPTEPRNMLNIDAVKKHASLINDGILFDLKRGGDYEQANAAKDVSDELGNVILCTIDILCSVYSRCIRQPVIWHNGDNLKIYRFMGETKVDAEMGELIKFKFKVMKLIQSLTIVVNAMENKLANELYDFQQKCVEFIDRGKLYFPQTLNALRSGKSVEQSIPEKIGEELLKNKLADIVSTFQKINSDMSAFMDQMDGDATRMFANDLSILRELGEIYGRTADKTEIKSFIQKHNVYSIVEKYALENATGAKHGAFNAITAVNEFIKNIASVLFLTDAEKKIMDQGISKLGLDKEIATTIGGQLVFTLDSEITSVRLRGRLFVNMANTLFLLERSLSRSRRPALYTILKGEDYNKQVNRLYEAYFSRNMGETANNILSPSDTSDDAVIAWYNTLYSKMGELKNVTKDSVKTQSLPKPQPPVIAVGKKRPLETNTGVAVSTTKKTRKTVKPAVSKRPAATATKRKTAKRTRRGGASPLIGGDVDKYQYYQLNDMLADISSRAASYLESVMTEYMSSHHQSSLIEKGETSQSLGGTIAPKSAEARKSRLYTTKRTSKHSPPFSPSRTRRTIRKTMKRNAHEAQQRLVGGFIKHLNEHHAAEISELMETLAMRFENGIVSLNTGVDGLFIYEPSEVELFLISVLGMNRGAQQENILLGMENNHDIFGEIDAKNVKLRLNDVYAKYSLAANTISPEIINIIVLTLVDNLMQTNKTGYFNTFIGDLVAILRQKRVDGRSFETKRDWGNVMNILFVLIHCVSNNTLVPPREVVQLVFT